MTIRELFAGYTDKEVETAAEAEPRDEVWVFAQIERRARKQRKAAIAAGVVEVEDEVNAEGEESE